MSQVSSLGSYRKGIFDLTNYGSGRESAELHASRMPWQNLQIIYTHVLPKAVSGLIDGLFSQEAEYKSRGYAPIYALEVSTRNATD